MNRQSMLAGGLALALMAVGALGIGWVQRFQRIGIPGVKVVERTVLRDDGAVVGTNVVALPETVLNFQSKDLPVSKLVSDWLPKDTVYGQKVYEAPDGFWTQATVVLMGTDRSSIHKPEYCLAGQGFQTQKIEYDTIEIREPHAYKLPVLKMTVQRNVTTSNGERVPQSALFVYWFVADQQLTADHNQRMKWMARDLLTRGILQRWAYISCFAACHPGQEDAAYARIREWIAAAVPTFQQTTGPASLAQSQ